MTKLSLSLAAMACALFSVASAQSLKIPSITRPPIIPPPQQDARETSRPRDVTEQLPPEVRRCGDAAAIDAANAEAAQRHDQQMTGAVTDLQLGVVSGAVQAQGSPGASAAPGQLAGGPPQVAAAPATSPLRRCPQ